MPRRNFFLILASAVISLMCYRASDRNPYGQYFAQVMEQIDERYVKDVDQQELFDAALQGMMSKLDENSAFISRSETTEFQEIIDQKFGGVGIEVALDPKTEQLTVLSPIVDTPAYKAGIIAGDKILKIDGQSTEGFRLKDAVTRMRGKPGEAVRLTIGREGRSEPIELTIERDIIKVDSVLGDTRNANGSWNFYLQEQPKLAYIRLTNFGENTEDEMAAALEQIEQQGSEGLILDLRFNPGGLLTSAVAVCDMFVDDGVIVSIRGRSHELRDEYHATAGGVHCGLPMVVLINGFSASASEIVAACLQDRDRATIIGSRSFGKGTVQNVIYVEGGRSLLKLTTADYWRPSNKNIHRHKNATEGDRWGVLPDEGFAVSLTDEETERLFKARRERDSLKAGRPPTGSQTEPLFDPQLKKGVEHLLQKLKGGAVGNAA